MTNEEYHADKSAINASGLKQLAISPAHYKASIEEPNKPTPAMEFGTLIHACVLEPETVQSVCKKLSSKAVSQLEEAEMIAKHVFAHPVGKLIESKFGEPEKTIFWEEVIPISDRAKVGVKCKARLDWYIAPCDQFPNGIIIDLKSASDASEDDFPKQAYNFGYHIQAAWYVRALGGNVPFVFLVAEKKAPYGVVAYSASESFLKAGNDAVNKLIRVYAECSASNIWPCYSQQIKQLDLPRWAKENYNV